MKFLNRTSYIPMKAKLFICFLLVAFWSIGHLWATDDVEVLRRLFVKQALSSRVDAERVKQVMNTLTPDGIWPGIDYTDVSRTGFRHTIHLDNLLLMARAYRQTDSPFRGDKRLREKFDLALKYWLAHDFRCENWWHNEIGTPNSFISLLLVMDESLTDEQKEGMLLIARRANLNAWGARPSGDRIKIAGMQAKTALFCRDEAELKMVLKVIEGEIKLVAPTERGIQVDYSFHHRIDRVNNTLSYGLGYVDAFAEWASNVYGTRYAFSEKAVRLAVDYYLDGICKQMVYGRIEDPGIQNRDITRRHGRLVFSSVTPSRLMKVTAYRHGELENVVKAREGKMYTPASFAKFFWQSEHFVFQRPHFYTSVRMFSSRNRNMEEPYNGEGLKNHFRGDGTNYLSLDGEEYVNLAPVYDWSCIPGATTVRLAEMPSEKEIQKKGEMDFVGGVTDGLYGAVAFDFSSPHNPLYARKSWFFFDDMYVCLGAGIKSEAEFPIVTTVNQCRLSGEVMVGASDGRNVLTSGRFSSDCLRWVWHDCVGYVFPFAQHVEVQNGQVQGAWANVNRQTSSSKAIVTDSVFKLLVNHGKDPRGEEYAYYVVPNVDRESLSRYVKNAPVRILSNTRQMQAVERRDGKLLYAVCYEAGRLDCGKGNSIEMNTPGLYMAHFDLRGKIRSLAVSDPTRKLPSMRLSVKGHCFPVDKALLSSCEYNALSDVTEMVVQMPQAEYAGRSVVIEFEAKK